MQKPPSLREFARYPTTTLTALAAIGVSLAYWNGFDVNPITVPPGVAVLEPWRLVTSVLPHLSLPHLAFNLYWLWVLGTLIERTFGSLRFLGIVLLFAVASSAAETAVSEPGVGLSGVGYGLFGLLWALKRRPGFENVIDKRTIQLFVVWFFICIATTYIGVMRVGNVAHGVGAGVGYLLGMSIAAHGVRRSALGATVAGFVATALVGAWASPPWMSLQRDYTASILANKGYEALKNGKDAAAAELLAKAVALNSGDAPSWYNYGVALEGLHRDRDAFDAYLRAARLDSRPEFRKSVATWGAYLAGTAIQNNDAAEARAILKNAMEIEPNDSYLWMWAGNEKWNSGDKAGAVESLEKAVSLDAGNEGARTQLEFVRQNMN